MKEKEFEVSLKVVKEIKMSIQSISYDEALKSIEDVVLKGDYEKLFTKEQTRNYVQVNKVKNLCFVKKEDLCF